MSGQKMDRKSKVELGIIIFLLILLTFFSNQKNYYFMLSFADAIITGPFEARLSSFASGRYDFTALWLSLLTSLAWVFVGWRIVYYRGQSFVKKLIKCMGVYLSVCSILYIVSGIVLAASPLNFTFAIFLAILAWLMTPFLGIAILYGVACDSMGIVGLFGTHIAFVCFLSTWLTLIGIFCIGAKMIRSRIQTNPPE